MKKIITIISFTFLAAAVYAAATRPEAHDLLTQTMTRENISWQGK